MGMSLSGTIRCTWLQCPNAKCESQKWDHWDIDFEADRFNCGTCQQPLGKPLFTCPLANKERACPNRAMTKKKHRR